MIRICRRFLSWLQFLFLKLFAKSPRPHPAVIQERFIHNLSILSKSGKVRIYHGTSGGLRAALSDMESYVYIIQISGRHISGSVSRVEG